VVLFADDTNILVIDKNINTLQEKINRVMIQLESWFSKNNLVTNTDSYFVISEFSLLLFLCLIGYRFIIKNVS
jgi:hypothetical protein